MRRIYLAIASLGLGTMLAGCGEPTNERPVFPVHGKLTYENKPMANAMISYYSTDPADRAVPSHATADENGNYVLQTYRSKDGAHAGDFIVTIYWPGKRAKNVKPDPTENPEDQLPPDRLKGKYYPVNASPLRATVKAEPDNEINFTLP